MTKTERIGQIEKELAKLKAEVKKEEKPWPDSFAEAMEITKYWGFWESNCGKYILCTCGTARGLAVNSCGTWASLSQMKDYWKNSGKYDGNEYYFKPFDTEKELKEWFLDED